MVQSKYVRIAPEWSGMDVYIIGGGTSVDPELVQRLRGRPNSKTIAVNSSYLIAPWADVLYFADDRWYTREKAERPKELAAFEGRILTTSINVKDIRLEKLKKIAPSAKEGLSRDRGTLAIERTSVTACLNICLHENARRIILIGVDNKDGPNGRVHHHDEYPWPRRETTWKAKDRQFKFAVDPLKAAGIEVVNASPISALTYWPKISLKAWLDMEDRNAQREGMGNDRGPFEARPHRDSSHPG